jgi:uncharacterized glyoxalase superfamily protein PhnB
MTLQSSYPVLALTDVAAARAFYERHFGFAARFVSDWYVHLTHRERADVHLALVDAAHDSIPDGYRRPVAGLLLNLEVDDVDAEYDRLRAAGVELALPLRDEPWGQRHFIVRAPEGVLVDVIRPIPPSADFAAQYVAVD